MRVRSKLALAGACLLAAAAPSAAAAATTVSVRVEGLKRTLLPSTAVRVPTSGSITKGGAPAGSCPAASGAGALDAATHHRWGGTYSSGLGIELTSVFGESHPFTSKDYWGLYINGRYAPVGMCDLKLHKGEQVLFAAVSVKGSTYPLALSAPRRATAGHAFTVTVRAYNARGVAKPLAGASVAGVKTNARGIATITVRKAGKVTLTADRSGYVRAEATVRVAA